MEERSSEPGTDDAFRKCERRGRRGACTNAELPSDKLQEMLKNLTITEKEDSSKAGEEKEKGT